MERVNVLRNEDKPKQARGLSLIACRSPFKHSLFCGNMFRSRLADLLIRVWFRDFASMQLPSFVRFVDIPKPS
jgi:hypothetical protein